MINLLVGLQGSGKTYYAVVEIWKHIKKMHQAEISGSTYKYTKIYTNIEGFIPNRYVETLDINRLYKLWEWELKQYKKYEERYEYKTPDDVEFSTKKKKNEILKPLLNIINIDLEEKRIEESTVDDIEVFQNDDQKLFESIKDPNASLDPEFIQYTLPEFEKQGFTNCLIVLDEAHNYFGGSLKPAWKRLLSYHRHYHDQDYLLISQDHKMFNFAVCQLSAYSIRAVNPIMRWRSDIFTYNIYSGGWISFSGDNKLETKSLKAKELIFNLYNSGGKKLQKSHFFKIVFKLLAAIAILIGFGIYAIGDFTHKEKHIEVVKNKPQEHNSTTPKKTDVENKNDVQKNKEEFSVEEFLIIGKSIIHKKSGLKFAFVNFERLLKESDQPVSFTENLDQTVTVYYELQDETLLNLKIKEKYEKIYNTIPYNH